MKKALLMVSLVAVSSLAQAYVPSKEARLVQKFEKDGVLTLVYMQETYADAYEYCSQLITLKYDAQSKELLSSDSKETCNRIR